MSTLLLLSLFVLGVLAVLAYLLIKALPQEKNDFTWVNQQRSFYDPTQKKYVPFPTYKEKGVVHLSVIVPAYNEKDRIPIMLEDTIGFLKERERKNASMTWEIVIVDDGSKDTTSEIVMEFCKRETTEKVRVVKLEKNLGKGGALKVGMLLGRGRYLLMADADAATKFSDVERLEKNVQSVEKDGHGIAVGSRHHLVSTETVANRKWYRNILMYGFHLLVLMCVQGINDTQCGFKLFTRKTAQTLFPSLHINRWAFDVELLYLARILGVPIIETSVNWTEIEGSKLDPLTSSIQMARDILRIRLCYTLGLWRRYQEEQALSDVSGLSIQELEKKSK